MADNGRISVEAMNEIINDRFPNVETVDYYGEELVINHTIPFDIFCIIVRNAVNGCFNSNGEYMPENLDFVIRLCVIDAYTNVDLPEDVNDRHYLVYRTDLYNTVLQFINRYQFDCMTNAIREAISVRNNANQALFDRKIGAAIDQINQLGEQFNQIFSGITEEDIKAFIDAVGDDGIDEGKIVKAVVEEQNKLRSKDESGDVVQFPAQENKDGE